MTLTQADYENAAGILNCSVPAIMAVAAVESSGGGFLPDGRPKILFEAHIFHRLTVGAYQITHPTLSTPTWNRTSYGPPGAYQWTRLNQARELDEDAALQSCSWGAFQIMGMNFKSCGFDSVRQFVAEMMRDENAHLQIFCRFLLSNPRMVDAIRKQDWPRFARLYNGPGYAQNRYDVKLAEAFSKHNSEVV